MHYFNFCLGTSSFATFMKIIITIIWCLQITTVTYSYGDNLVDGIVSMPLRGINGKREKAIQHLYLLTDTPVKTCLWGMVTTLNYQFLGYSSG